MNDIKTELSNLISSAQSKSYPRMIKARPNLLQAITEYCSNWQIDNLNESLWLFMHEQSPPVCKYGNKIKFDNYQTGYKSFCSIKCQCKAEHQKAAMSSFWSNNPDAKETMQERKASTNLEKYGVDNLMKDSQFVKDLKEANIEKYGVASNLQRPEVQEKIKARNMEKFGVEFPFQAQVVQDKSKATFFQNHGAHNSMQIARKAFLDANDGQNPFQVYANDIAQHWQELGICHNKQRHIDPEVLALLNDKDALTARITGKTMYELVRELGVSDCTIFNRLYQYGIRDLLSVAPKSAMEIEFQGLLEELKIPYVRGNRSIIHPLEIDFYFPEIKVGVELNGLYWHSSKFKKDSYHSDKYELAKSKGVTILQYWEDEWAARKSIIVNRIAHLHHRSKKVVGARKVTLDSNVSYKEETEFLDKFHIQGGSNDRTGVIGGKLNDVMVSVLAYKLKSGVLEITRFATDGAASYAGLFSRMLSHVITTLSFTGDVVSFSDNNHSDGNLYKAAGFTHVSDVAPSYYVTNGAVRMRRERFMKNKIKANYPDAYDETLTESQMCENMGLFRVWDSGKIKWVKTVG